LVPAVLVLSVLTIGAGCGSNGAEEPPQGGDLPVTAQALAAVAAEHAGKPDSTRADDDLTEEFTGHAVGAELRYGSDGEYDGDSLALAVGHGLSPKERDCAGFGDRVSGCVAVDGGVLAWEKQVPEEDPGVVYLVVPKGNAVVLLYYAGPDITGDPRKLDMPISVDDLRAIAADPRVDITTSQAALDAGDKVSHWRD
jgi:hypothetical protein